MRRLAGTTEGSRSRSRHDDGGRDEIDASALESLEAIADRLTTSGVTFHLSGVKGPVMDRLKRPDFLHHRTGEVFLSQYQAIEQLSPEVLDGS